ALEKNRRLCTTAGQEARNDLLFEHTAQFPRDTRSEEKARLADVDSEATGCTDGIIDHFCRGWQHGLLAVVGWHDPAAALKHFFHTGQPALVQYELYSGSLSGNFLRQVIHGRPQATVDDHGVSALSSKLKGPQEFLAIVANVVSHCTARPTSSSFWLM